MHTLKATNTANKPILGDIKQPKNNHKGLTTLRFFHFIMMLALCFSMGACELHFNANPKPHRQSTTSTAQYNNGVLWTIFHDAPWLSLIDAKTGLQIRKIRLKHPAAAIKASPSGQWVAVSMPNKPSVMIFNAQNQTLAHTLRLDGPVQTLEFNGDNLWIAYTTANSQTKLVAFTVVSTSQKPNVGWAQVQTLTMPSPIKRLHIIPDLNRIWLITHKNTLLVLQKNEDTPIWQLSQTHATDDWGQHPIAQDWSESAQLGLTVMAYSNEIVVTDAELNMKHKIHTAELPAVAKLDVQNNAIWVLANRGQVLQQFELDTFELVQEIDVGQGCNNMVLTPWHGWAITCQHSKNIFWVKPNEGQANQDSERPTRTLQTKLPHEPSGMVLL